MLRVLLSFLLLLASIQIAAASAEDRSTSPALARVQFMAQGGMQLDLWVDGRRVGFTPVTVPLALGKYQIVAHTEGIVPVIQRYTVAQARPQASILPVIPLDARTHSLAHDEVEQFRAGHPGDVGAILAQMYLNADPMHGLILAGDVERLAPKDPVGMAMRARAQLNAGNPAEAQELADAAVYALPHVGLVWRTRAAVLLTTGHLQEALDAANQSVLVEPGAWRNLRLRAGIHQKLGNERAAANDSARADEIYAELVQSRVQRQ